MIKGSPKFDSLTVAKLSVSFLGPTLDFVGEAAFADSQTGQTHGWTRNTQWSPETINKLKELRAQMEVDLGQLHLSGGGEVLVGPAATVSPGRGLAPESGLSEHLGKDGIPQV